MQLELAGDMKFKKASYLRIEREYFVHEAGLMEMPEEISREKVGAHLRVRGDGEMGMEGLMGVLAVRKRLGRLVERGEDIEVRGPEE